MRNLLILLLLCLYFPVTAQIDENFESILSDHPSVDYSFDYSSEFIFLSENYWDSTIVHKFDFEGNQLTFQGIPNYRSPVSVAADSLLLASGQLLDFNGASSALNDLLISKYAANYSVSMGYLLNDELILAGTFRETLDHTKFHTLRINEALEISEFVGSIQISQSRCPSVLIDHSLYLTGEFEDQTTAFYEVDLNSLESTPLKLVPFAQRERGNSSIAVENGIITTGTYFTEELYSYLLKFKNGRVDSTFIPEDFNDQILNHSLPVDLAYYKENIAVGAFYIDKYQDGIKCYENGRNCYELILRVFDTETGATLDTIDLYSQLDTIHIDQMEIIDNALFMVGFFQSENGFASSILRYELSREEFYIENEKEAILSLNDHSRPFAYPNPTYGHLQLKNIKDVNSITVTDLSGRTVFVSLDGDFINLSHLKKGIYFLKFETPHQIISQRIILH